MHIKFFLLALSFASLSNISIVYAKSNYVVSCPETISTVESIKSTPSGWQSWQAKTSQTSKFWDTAAFYDGHPDEEASLAPSQSDDEKHQEKKNYTSTWQFGSKRERDIYVSCGYQHSTYKLIQTLPKHITQCIVTYDSGWTNKGLVPKKIVCFGK